MKSSNISKGLRSLKTIQSIRTSADSENRNHDFLKLYMLEKERSRLHNEQVKLLLRLEPINNRLKEIEEIYTASFGKKNSASPEENEDNRDEGKKEWKTISIDY